MQQRKRLLINWVYYQPVGHAIEAFRYGQAFRNANPDLHIAIALNARSAVELGVCLPAIDAVYPVDVDAFERDAGAEALAAIPQEWDYCFTDPRHEYPMGSDALDRCEQAMRAHIRAGVRNQGWSLPGFPDTDLSPLALQLPDEQRQFAAQFIAAERAPRISMLFGSGSEGSRTPPLAFWHRLISELLSAYPNAEIILLGAWNKDRSATKGITPSAVDRLVQEFPQLRNGFDLGLLNQLAIAERCDLHISPHTGMSFAIQCVGVPWLVLSGASTAEYIVNGVPFVSIYPDCPRYPCGPWFAPARNPMLPECHELKANDQPFLCLNDASLAHKLPQILHAAQQLIAGQLSYQQCVQQHYRAMIPRLGKQPGDHFMEGWPTVMEEGFEFQPATD